jgi:hypothetical protein
MRPQISYDDVAQAAAQLAAEGRPVGPTKVRELLGRGSFSTVQKHLSEWEERQAELKTQAEEEKRVGPPEELFAELQKIMAAYWPHAVTRAKEQMRPEWEAIAAKHAEAVLKNKEATVEIGNLENRLEAALVKAGKMEDAERRASEANQRIIALQGELSRLEKIEARFQGQEQLVQNLQEQASSVKSLLEQNAALNRKAEALSSELSDATIKMAKLETRLEVLGKNSRTD